MKLASMLCDIELNIIIIQVLLVGTQWDPQDIPVMEYRRAQQNHHLVLPLDSEDQISVVGVEKVSMQLRRLLELDRYGNHLHDIAASMCLFVIFLVLAQSMLQL